MHLDKWLNQNHREQLRALQNMLVNAGYYSPANAPYPVDHGPAHVDRVMRSAAALLKKIDLGAQLHVNKAEISDRVFELGAAILLHDMAHGVAMLQRNIVDPNLRTFDACLIRVQQHLVAQNVGAFLQGSNLYHVAIIIWAQLSDVIWSDRAKLAYVNAQSTAIGRHHLRVWTPLVRLANLLDIGPHRLLPGMPACPPNQKTLCEVHAFADADLDPPIIEFRPAAPYPGRPLEPRPEVARALAAISREIRRQITELAAWLPELRLVDELLHTDRSQVEALLFDILAENRGLTQHDIEAAIRGAIGRLSYRKSISPSDQRDFLSVLPEQAEQRCKELFDDLAALVNGFDRLSLQHISAHGRRTIVNGRGIKRDAISSWLLRPVPDDPLIDSIVKSRNSLVIGDTTVAHETWKPSPETDGVKSWACIPIVTVDGVSGLITLDHSTTGHFSPDLPTVLDDYSRRHGQEFAWIFSQYITSRAANHAEIIESVLGALSEPVDTSAIFKIVVEQIVRNLKCAHCTIFIAESANGTTHLVPKQTYPGPQLAADRRFPVDEGGLAARVFKTGIAEIHDDATTDPAFFPASHNSAKPRSMAIAPIKWRGQSIGVICADQNAYGWFNEYDLKLLETIGKQAGIPLRRSEAIATLHSITHAMVASCSDPSRDCARPVEQLLRRILDGAILMTNATTGVIYKINPDTLKVEPEYAPPDYRYPRPRMDNPHGLTRTVIRYKETLPVPDVHATKQKYDAEPCAALKKEFASVIAVPLKLSTANAGERVIGVLFLDYKEPREFAETEITFLEVLCGQGAAAIRNAELIRSLRLTVAERDRLEEHIADLHKLTNVDATITRVGNDVVALLGKRVSATIDLYDAAKQTFTEHYPFGTLSARLGMRPRPDGTGQYVVKHRRALYYPDTRHPNPRQPRLRPELGALRVVSFAALPLIASDGTPLGVLFINSTKPIPFTEQTRTTLEIFCSHAVIALENARLHQQRAMSIRSLRTCIVHGHEQALNVQLQSLLLDELGMPPPFLLDRSADPADTVTARFEKHAADCDVVFVIAATASATDPASTNGDGLQHELEYFATKLGREPRRIILLHHSQAEIPRNVAGVEYVSISNELASAHDAIGNALDRISRWATPTAAPVTQVVAARPYAPE